MNPFIEKIKRIFTKDPKEISAQESTTAKQNVIADKIKKSKGIDPTAASETNASLSLGAVYTALLTQAVESEKPDGMAREGKARRISALEMLNRHEHLVLLGDPGSGKSTFVNFAATALLERGAFASDL